MARKWGLFGYSCLRGLLGTLERAQNSVILSGCLVFALCVLVSSVQGWEQKKKGRFVSSFLSSVVVFSFSFLNTQILLLLYYGGLLSVFAYFLGLSSFRALRSHWYNINLLCLWLLCRWCRCKGLPFSSSCGVWWIIGKNQNNNYLRLCWLLRLFPCNIYGFLPFLPFVLSSSNIRKCSVIGWGFVRALFLWVFLFF